MTGGPPEEYVDDGPDILLPQLQEATAGEYEILGELGRGGMAAVYLANDLSLNRKVAIKTMLPELVSKSQMVQRFKREAQMAAGLSHPHIIQIHSVRETKRLVYFVMKYIEGRSLGSIVGERGALDVDSARLIIQQSGSALSFAHHRGIIHRDVKPANIMIDENGWAVVTDFGIAKQDTHQLTATGQAVGTPHYMSPEQFGDQPITGASDQYALGIVSYEILAGKKPFDGGTFAEIITQQLFKEPPDIRTLKPDLPEGVVGAIGRMLSKDPKNRFPDLDAAVAAMGPPQHVDAVRGQLTALARSGEQKKLRLSVPMSPVSVTRPSVKTTLVNTGESTPKAASPAVPTPVPSSGGARSAAMWVGLALVVLVGGGAFAAWRMRSGRAAPTSVALTRAIELYQRGQHDASRSEFELAAKELPNSATPHVYLARLARDGGNLDLARDEAAKAVQLEPRNGPALREVGAVMLARGNYEGARRFYVRAIDVNREDRVAMGWLACSLTRLGAKEQAARWLSRAGPGDWSGCVAR